MGQNSLVSQRLHNVLIACSTSQDKARLTLLSMLWTNVQILVSAREKVQVLNFVEDLV